MIVMTTGLAGLMALMRQDARPSPRPTSAPLAVASLTVAGRRSGGPRPN
ncbi:hypothetical protein QE389_000176 [Brevundimonas sp. SORGH_AS 993]|nr:hypothetical protein [Brevundimonas sp. SORGH_AS_0993]